MAELRLSERSHHFRIDRITVRSRPVIESFARKYVQWGMARAPGNRYIRQPLKVFAASTAARDEYRFHINLLDSWKRHVAENMMDENSVVSESIAPPRANAIVIAIQEHWVDKDYQTPVIAYLTDAGIPRAKFVALQTGRGKSYCTMRAMEKIAQRTVIMVRPMYIDKWVEDMERTFELQPGDVMKVQGSKQLLALLSMADSGDLEAAIIVVSNKTMQQWIKQYELFGAGARELGYPCDPDEFYEFIGAGVRVIDEVHQDFHLNFKMDLYTNVQRSISLSATMLSDDDFINRMYEIAYPSKDRYKGPAYVRYTHARAAMYQFKRPHSIRCKEPATGNYSHNVFEHSVLKQPEALKNYVALIEKLIQIGYFDKKKDGDQALIFCASIDFATYLTAYFKLRYPRIDVRRYVEDDPFENLQGDMVFSTVQSAGTAVDLPQLTFVLMTNALSTSQGNVQGFGRLRELKDGRNPMFVYMVCSDIQKHLDYHQRKQVLLTDGRCLTYDVWNMPGLL